MKEALEDLLAAIQVDFRKKYAQSEKLNWYELI
jgi:hypothetical protein